jgi:hypothetical protein
VFECRFDLTPVEHLQELSLGITMVFTRLPR